MFCFSSPINWMNFNDYIKYMESMLIIGIMSSDLVQILKIYNSICLFKLQMWKDNSMPVICKIEGE